MLAVVELTGAMPPPRETGTDPLMRSSFRICKVLFESEMVKSETHVSVLGKGHILGEELHSELFVLVESGGDIHRREVDVPDLKDAATASSMPSGID